MNLLSINRIIDADLKVVSLLDVLNKMKSENFFDRDKSFYLDKLLDENYFVFEVPREKIFPRQIHELKYLDKEKHILITSGYKYQSMLFSFFLANGMPLGMIVLTWNDLTIEKLTFFGLMIIGCTLFLLIGSFLSLREDSKNIEREIIIRLNYLLRQKGYRIKL